MVESKIENITMLNSSKSYAVLPILPKLNDHTAGQQIEMTSENIWNTKIPEYQYDA